MLGTVIGKTGLNVQRATPLTTDSVTIGEATQLLILAPAGTIAAATVVFPSPIDKKIIKICSTQIITALTLSSTKTIIGGVTTLAVGGFAEFMFSATDNAWLRVG